MATTGTATVVFTDLVGSTELRARVGDDRADALRRSHDALVRAAVASHGGTVVKGLGDGVMAAFASAATGVAAAIAVQQAVDLQNRRSADEPLSVRVGVSSGDVVWEDDDCFGVPVVESARLCAAAEGGQVLVSDVVRLLARAAADVPFRPLGPRELKGLGLVEVTEVGWAPLPAVPSAEGQPELPTMLDTSAHLGFSGRDDAVEAVLLAWKQALGGTRQAVLVSGEPGIGKTRLAAEAARRAHEQGATVLYGRCEEDLGAPYQPFAEALDALVGALPPQVVQPRLGRHPGELVRLCPAVADALPDLPPPLRSDAETERYRLFEAVASWLTTAAEPDGLVLVLDDLHWATRPTLLLLQHVLLAAPEARVLVVGTYRDTDLQRRSPLSALLADLRRVPGVTRLALSGLDRDGVTGLVADAAGHELDADGLALAAEIHSETEGNPFFVGEVLRHLRETGAVYLRDGRWVHDRSGAGAGIPEGVREVVGRRLDRLSPDANASLSTASVLGRDFELADVVAVTGLSEDAVVAGLDEATSARLVEETGVGCYRFSHALVRSTLYDELSATRRARAHASVGAHLEATRPDDVAALARHFAAAVGPVELARAVRYSKAAGDAAMAQLAHDGAVEWYRQALELLEGGPSDPGSRADLLVALGDAQRSSGERAYRTTLLDAAALARENGLDDALVRAALANSRGFWSMAGELDAERVEVLRQALAVVGEEDSADRARLLVRLAVELMFTADRAEREALSGEAVSVVRRVGDPLALADVLAEAIACDFTVWGGPRAKQHALELVALARSLDDPARIAMAETWRFVVGLLQDDDLGEAVAAVERARALVEELGQPTLRWLVGAWSCVPLQWQGRLDDAEARATAAFEVGSASGQPDAYTWLASQVVTISRARDEVADLLPAIEEQVAAQPGFPSWQVALALAYADVGDVAAARAVLQRLLPDGRLQVAEDVMWVFVVPSLLDVAVDVGQPQAVEALYDALLPFRGFRAHAGVSYLGSCELYLGRGAAALGRLGTATEHLERSAEVHRRDDAPWHLAWSLAELAAVRAASGDATGAERTRAEALALGERLAVRSVEVRLARAAALGHGGPPA